MHTSSAPWPYVAADQHGGQNRTDCLSQHRTFHWTTSRRPRSDNWANVGRRLPSDLSPTSLEEGMKEESKPHVSEALQRLWAAGGWALTRAGRESSRQSPFTRPRNQEVHPPRRGHFHVRPLFALQKGMISWKLHDHKTGSTR